MEIKIIKHEEDSLNHYIEIRVEQELEPFNSINQDVILSKLDTVDLSQDELYTLAYKKVKDIAIRVFSEVQYEEESDNAVEFTLIESKHKSIEIIGIDMVTKEIGNDFKTYYTSILKDQYGDYFKDGNIELKENYPNVTLINGLLTIGDFSGQITLKSSYYSLSNEFTIDVTQTPKVMTQEEIILTAIAELYEMQSNQEVK